jgi:hypothetical protein
VTDARSGADDNCNAASEIKRVRHTGRNSRVGDIEVEVKPRGGSPNNAQSGR